MEARNSQRTSGTVSHIQFDYFYMDLRIESYIADIKTLTDYYYDGAKKKAMGGGGGSCNFV